MATVGAVCGRALRLIGVQDPTEAISADNFQTALEALNAMMLRWEANGITMGWQAAANPSDVLAAPPEAEEAVVYQLAARLCPEYQMQLPSAVAAGAQEFLSNLRNDVVINNPIKYRSTEAPLGRRVGRWNIYTDSPV